jgi:hypothetical protein
MQAGIYARMDGFERIGVVAAMFRRVRGMLELRHDDSLAILRQLHGPQVSEQDYRAIGKMMSDGGKSLG